MPQAITAPEPEAAAIGPNCKPTMACPPSTLAACDVLVTLARHGRKWQLRRVGSNVLALRAEPGEPSCTARATQPLGLQHYTSTRSVAVLGDITLPASAELG